MINKYLKSFVAKQYFSTSNVKKIINDQSNQINILFWFVKASAYFDSGTSSLWLKIKYVSPSY